MLEYKILKKGSDFKSWRKLHCQIPMQLFTILAQAKILPEIDTIITQLLYEWLEENKYIEPVDIDEAE